jgi:alkaline phosphatase
MIGDGMGPAHIKAFRIFNNDPSTPGIDDLIWDQYLVGQLSTDAGIPAGTISTSEQSGRAISTGLVSDYADKDSYQVTDSAASATAYSTGRRTLNRAIAVDTTKQKVLTILEQAKRVGKKVGLVATSQIVHATPAAFIAHVDDREKYNEIADQFVDNQFSGKPLLDVMLGGGWQYFDRHDRNLINELKGYGYSIFRTKQQLVSSKTPVAGLFADVEIPQVKDRGVQHPSLRDMSQYALDHLKNSEKGFFLMIEGSQIDWASHDNDIAGTLYEMKDFNDAIEAVLTFARNSKDTLVLITADHETGGLSVGARHQDTDYYEFDVQPVKKLTKSIAAYANEALNNNNINTFVNDLNISLTTREQQALAQLLKSREQYPIQLFLGRLLNRVTYTGWTTLGHTGVDVNLYAFGPGSEVFRGYHRNSFIGQQIMYWLNSKN